MRACSRTFPLKVCARTYVVSTAPLSDTAVLEIVFVGGDATRARSQSHQHFILSNPRKPLHTKAKPPNRPSAGAPNSTHPCCKMESGEFGGKARVLPRTGIKGQTGQICPASHHLTLLVSVSRTQKAGQIFPAYEPWHFLYFFPLPQGHGSLRPVFCPVTTGVAPRESSPPMNCNSAISRSFLRWMLRVKSSIDRKSVV